MSGPAVRTREFTDPTCPWAFSRPTGMRLLCLHGLPWSSSGAPDARHASDLADARMLRRHGGSYGLRIEAGPDGDSGDPPIATSARSATIGIVLQYASGGRDERRARYSPQVSSAARGPARLGLPRAIGPADGCRRAAGSHRHDHARGAYPATNTWRRLPPSPLTPRQSVARRWTGPGVHPRRRLRGARARRVRPDRDVRRRRRPPAAPVLPDFVRTCVVAILGRSFRGGENTWNELWDAGSIGRRRRQALVSASVPRQPRPAVSPHSPRGRSQMESLSPSG